MFTMDENGRIDTWNQGAQRILLFQIVRELLFNVVKHAGVQEAQVNLQEAAGGITVVVSDRGHGFQVEEALADNNNAFGLHSVRERLRLFDGTTASDSRPGQGTEVTFFLPQPAPADSDEVEAKRRADDG